MAEERASVDISRRLARQGHWLLQIGMALLVYSSLDGFADSSAPTGLAWLGIVLWGLRMDAR